MGPSWVQFGPHALILPIWDPFAHVCWAVHMTFSPKYDSSAENSPEKLTMTLRPKSKTLVEDSFTEPDPNSSEEPETISHIPVVDNMVYESNQIEPRSLCQPKEAAVSPKETLSSCIMRCSQCCHWMAQRGWSVEYKSAGLLLSFELPKKVT